MVGGFSVWVVCGGGLGGWIEDVKKRMRWSLLCICNVYSDALCTALH